MPGQEEEPRSGALQTWNTVGQPIIVYQGPPPETAAAPTRNAVALLFVLAALTLCAAVAGWCAFKTWGTGGLVAQLESQQRITREAETLKAYYDQLTIQNGQLKSALDANLLRVDRILPDAPEHPLQNDIARLQKDFDRGCNAIADRRAGVAVRRTASPASTAIDQCSSVASLTAACRPARCAERCVWRPIASPPFQRCLTADDPPEPPPRQGCIWVLYGTEWQCDAEAPGYPAETTVK
jgi:hypothetical protein